MPEHFDAQWFDAHIPTAEIIGLKREMCCLGAESDLLVVRQSVKRLHH